jgi:membrane fusion protein (multidrug efflux system)
MAAKLVKGIAAVVAVCAIAGAGYYLFVMDHDGGGKRRARGPVPVVIAAATLGPLTERIEAVGTAQSNESVTITAKVTEVVTKIEFIEGQTVEKGDVLVRLRDNEQRAQLAKAEADLLAAKQQYDRIKALAERGNASASQLEQATAKLESLKAEIEAIRARIEDRTIRAPFAGVIGIRQVSPGTLIQPGTAITTLDDLSIIKVDFSVPESYARVMRVGQDVSGTVAAYPKRRFTGKITVVSPRVNTATRAITVRASIPNGDQALKPGMLMVVNVIKARRTALLIPEEAIVPVRELKYVYVVGAGNTVTRVTVSIGIRRPGEVEIVKGLKAGDRVVVEGTSRVAPGSKVRIVRTVKVGAEEQL